MRIQEENSIREKEIIMGSIDKMINSDRLKNNLKQKEEVVKSLFRKIFKLSKELEDKEIVKLLLSFEEENIYYQIELSEFYYEVGALKDEIINH